MALNPLLAMIERRTGTQLKDSRLDRIHNLITELLTTTSLSDLINTLSQQSLNSPLWQQIIQEITVGETYFFRNQPQFNALRDLILPGLIAQRRAQGQRYLRLWSAACSTGEEPYSLAILLRELLPDWRDWSLFILATDINHAVLEAAAAGQYRAGSFRGETPIHVQGRWFQQKNGLYHLDQSVRQMVSFQQINLIESSYPSLDTYTINHDIVLCRNVTIYFDNAQTQEVINRLYGSLRDDGWLFVGHSEPQLHVYDAFHMRHYDGTIIYQKPSAEKPLIPKRDAVEVPPLPPRPTGMLTPSATGTLRPRGTGMLTPPATGTLTPRGTGMLTPPATGTLTPRGTGMLTPSGTGSLSAHQTGSLTPPATGTLRPRGTGMLTPPTTGTLTPRGTGMLPPLKATPTEPTESEKLVLEARRAADIEDWPTAVSLLEQVEESQRYNPLFHFVRALVLAQSDMDSALEALAQAVYCDPRFALGHYWLGELWAQRGAIHRATTFWRRASKALEGLPDSTAIPGEKEMTALTLREMLAYRLGNA